MSRELKRIQRLRDLRGHRERAAQRELALSRQSLSDSETSLNHARDAFGEAADAALHTRITTAPDFEMERLRVLFLSRRVDTAEGAMHAARQVVDVRKSELDQAHLQVEQIDRWSDMTRTELRANELRLDRFESDEIAARIASKS